MGVPGLGGGATIAWIVSVWWFDFLGYVFSVDGTVKVSRPAVERFTARATRLQEQGADKSRIEAYARRWVSWVQAGVRELLRWEGIGAGQPDLWVDMLPYGNNDIRSYFFS